MTGLFTNDNIFKNSRNHDFNTLNRNLQVNNVTVQEQLVFRKGITTEKAVFTLTDNSLTALNQHNLIGGIC
jgi:hypothetical protein